MNKLKQKEWMTMAEAASYLNLSMKSKQPITEVDLLQHAAAGELTLSIKCFSYIKGAFGFFYPRGSRPPQPETNPPEHDGLVLYLGQHSAANQKVSLLKFYECLKKMENDEVEPDPDEIWEGPAIAVMDEDAFLPARVWDILYNGSCQHYLEAQLKRCIKQADADTFSIIDFRKEQNLEFEFNLVLVEPCQEGAASVKLSELVEDSIICVRRCNLEAFFDPNVSGSANQYARPATTLETQKEAIIHTLKNQLQLDPLNLPERKSGPYKGAKGRCWEILKINRQLFTDNSFKEAWKELRRCNEIIGG